MSDDPGEASFYLAFGDNVRVARKDAGLDQEQLARSLDLSRSSIANLEAGRQRSLVHQAVRIAEECGTTLEMLLPSDNEADIESYEFELDLAGQPQPTVEFVTRVLNKARVLFIPCPHER